MHLGALLESNSVCLAICLVELFMILVGILSCYQEISSISCFYDPVKWCNVVLTSNNPYHCNLHNHLASLQPAYRSMFSSFHNKAHNCRGSLRKRTGISVFSQHHTVLLDSTQNKHKQTSVGESAHRSTATTTIKPTPAQPTAAARECVDVQRFFLRLTRWTQIWTNWKST